MPQPRIWSLYGQAMHAVMERADTDNALVEERLAMGIAGVKVSGQFDLYTGKGVLIDFKTTSVWTRIYGSRDNVRGARHQ